jgi:hypothetical protein
MDVSTHRRHSSPLFVAAVRLPHPPPPPPPLTASCRAPQAPALDAEGPGQVYCRLVTGLADSDPQAFICHYYNFYFAHTAGGRMMGKQVGQRRGGWGGGAPLSWAASWGPWAVRR